MTQIHQHRFIAEVVVTCDTENSVYAPGIVDIEDGRIHWVGSKEDAPDTSSTTKEYDVGGLLMPGLVNAHCHTPMTLLRGVGDGLPLQRWLTEAMWPREGLMTSEDVWWGMTFGSAEMLQSGVTTSCEMYLFEEAVVDAAQQTGARLVMTPVVISESNRNFQEHITDLTHLYERHHDPAGRTTVGVAAHSAYDLGIDPVAELAGLARSLDTTLHLHLAETQEESADLEREFGQSITRILYDNGVFDAAQQTGARLVMTPVVISESNRTFKEHITDLTQLYDRHHDPAGRTTVGVAAHSAYDLGIDPVAELAGLARSLDTTLHLHLAETQEESADLERKFGQSITRILYDNGVFDGRVLAAHSVWVDRTDIELMAEGEVAVAHCPVSNMKLGAGIAPLVDLRAAGVTVGYGTDGPASNDSLDLWEEVKIAPLLARVKALESTAITASETLAMATREGAAAVGLHDTGSLEVGNAADMIRLDLEQSTFVPVTSPDELIAHLAWSGSNRLVTDVWVAGKQVVVGGEVQTVDTERARAQVQERARRLAGF